MAGRFAPSPTSALHIGNLRTAIVAFLLARTSGKRFVMRVENLDQQRVAAAPGIARQQLEDLARLGIDWDECVWQSDRIDRYQAAILHLKPLLYECFCSRKEILAAAQAPHDGFRPYGGTCLQLSDSDKAELRKKRPAALRVHAAGAVVSVTDRWSGVVSQSVDDFVLQRGDGVFAYNLAVVVDDIAQGVDQIVRGDDLLSSSPRQAWLTTQLGGDVPEYAHVPLVVSSTGRRLSKRDGDVTLADLGTQRTLSLIGESLNLCGPSERVTMAQLRDRFDPQAMPREPWVWEH